MEIKFLKDKKNVFIIAVTLLLSAILFTLVYTIAYNANSSKSNVDFVSRTGHEKISKNKTKEVVVVKQDLKGDLLEKTRIKIELEDLGKAFSEMYPTDKYEIVNFSDDSIILKEKQAINFIPNKYYIGQKDGYVTVFKSDDNGNLFIENEGDVSSKKVESLPIADRELVVNYKLSSLERDEVQYILSELET